MLQDILSKSVLGICAWDLPALIVLIVLIVVFAVHRHKLKRCEEDLKDQLSDLLAEEAVREKDMGENVST